MLKIPRTPLVLIALFLLAVAAISPVPAHGELLIKPGDHVAICGDAAAGDTGYATFVAVERVPGVFSGQFGWATQSPQDLLKNLFDVTWGGHWKVDPNGHYGKWVNGTAGKQSKVILKMPPAQVGKLLDAELARPLK